MKYSLHKHTTIFISTLFLIVNILVTACSAKDTESSVLGFHFVLRNVSLQDAKMLSERAKSYGFSHMIVQLTDGVEFEHSVWTKRRDSWDKSELLTWIHHTKSLGLEIVPEIKLLTHQEKFFQNNRPKYLYNDVTYFPSDDVYKEVFLFLDEVIRVFKPDAIHIGHDEVAGHNRLSKHRWLKKSKRVLPANLFLSDVKSLDEYLCSKGITTWMWGDMLVSSKEFPSMLERHLHGDYPGYGQQLRKQLPKDITILDWHYWDKQTHFPTLSTLQAEGFQVMATTWKSEETTKNFYNYAKKNGASGFIATSWFHVQRKEWDLVDLIMKNSSKYYYEKSKQ